MAIPRSTIIMALVTCVPFGLAIWDYARASDAPASSSKHEDKDDRLEEAASTGELERFAEREKERREREVQLEDVLGQVVGKPTASLGPVFGSIVALGITDSALAKADEITTALRKLEHEYDMRIRLEADGGVLSDITISTPTESTPQPICRALQHVPEMWGVPAARIEGTRVWLDPKTGQRAALFDSGGVCELTFERYAAPAAWLARTGPSVVPLAAIGQPHAKLVKSLDPLRLDLSTAESHLEWQAPGLGAGLGPTEISATVAGGKVVGLVAAVTASETTRGELLAHLRAQFGAPAAGIEDVETWEWPKRKVSLHTDGNELRLAVGDVEGE